MYPNLYNVFNAKVMVILLLLAETIRFVLNVFKSMRVSALLKHLLV